jgi:hypothetical protein
MSISGIQYEMGVLEVVAGLSRPTWHLRLRAPVAPAAANIPASGNRRQGFLNFPALR